MTPRAADAPPAHPAVFIVEDHPFLARSLGELLGDHLEVEVCGTARSCEETLESLERRRPELLIVDVALATGSGIDLVRTVAERWPETTCLMLSGHDSQSYVRESLAAGARGYVVKGDPYELFDAVREVLAGRVFLSRAVRERRADDDGSET